MEQVKKCPYCGELYEVYMYTVVDQSACPSCRAKAKANMNKHTANYTGLQNAKQKTTRSL